MVRIRRRRAEERPVQGVGGLRGTAGLLHVAEAGEEALGATGLTDQDRPGSFRTGFLTSHCYSFGRTTLIVSGATVWPSASTWRWSTWSRMSVMFLAVKMANGVA